MSLAVHGYPESAADLHLVISKACWLQNVPIFRGGRLRQVPLVFRIEITESGDNYQNMLENNKFNLKNTWQILKDIIGKSKPGNMSNKFAIDGTIVEDSKIVKGGGASHQPRAPALHQVLAISKYLNQIIFNLINIT